MITLRNSEQGARNSARWNFYVFHLGTQYYQNDNIKNKIAGQFANPVQDGLQQEPPAPEERDSHKNTHSGDYNADWEKCVIIN